MGHDKAHHADHESGGADAIDATGLTGAGGSGGTPALVLSTSNSAGAASTFIRTNDQLALFDATAPSTQAFGDSAAAGSAAVAARRDHKHAMPSERVAASTTPAPVGTATVGTGTTDARSDHVHATGAGTPYAVSTSAAIGSGPTAAMTDHVHAHEAAHLAHDTLWDTAGDVVVGTGADTAAKLAITVPAANILEVLGVVNGETTATWKAVHDGTAAAAVGTAAAGTALTASHRDHVHATGAGTPSTQAFGDAAATGSGPAAAMTDHKHAMPNARPAALRATGVLAETVPRWVVTSNSNYMTSAKLHLTLMEMDIGTVVSNITFVTGTTPITVGINQWFSLFDTTTPRARLCVTADDTVGAWVANTAKTLFVARQVTDAAITTGGGSPADKTLTSATAAFTAGDVGKKVIVIGAGAAGVPLGSAATAVLISSVTNATTAVLDTSCSTTVSGAMAYIATPYTTTYTGQFYLGNMVKANTPPSWTITANTSQNSVAGTLGFQTAGDSTATLTDPSTCPNPAASLVATVTGITQAWIT
jgi:hypothetical protein